MSNPVSRGAPLKGSIVRIDTSGPQIDLPFQYNPASIRRSLRQNTVGGESGGHSEVMRFTLAPTETFTLQIEIDGLAPPERSPNPRLATDGIFPNLYALELLMYPDLDSVRTASQALAGGALEVAPAVVPLILLVLGPQRVVPVAIESYEVVEQIFGPNLSPLRATVDLNLRAVSYSDVVTSNPAYSRFTSYQRGKQALSNGGSGS